MVALRCGGSAAAHMSAHTITAPRSGDGRSAILPMRAGIRELPLRASLSPSSVSPRTVRCSVFRRRRTGGHCFQNRGMTEGWEALKAATADMFRPLLLNISDMRSLNTVYDLEDYQIGMLFGVFAGLVGVYQLWRAAPPIFVDAALGYIIYKLSVISSELHRLRKSNSLINRLKFGFLLFMALKDFKNKYVLLDIIRLPLFFLNVGTFMFDVAGLKKYGRRVLISFVNLLKMRGGIKEIFRIVWYPGYVSPYDDSFGRR
ncbi:hypothetical protein CFC21_072301 [Triticum aestivum]|uniref:Uncharacterized protein n=3 Tax=Triticum TaxID=4564 RepID=A0A9R0XCE8_TRITD|nr:uncharacterized protein LOC123112478 [Triticum aestivum]KAF7066288.1 hypothetical protein CFC21_072301 [Triticum aestivum]VAI34001.1 unnamed protein product [Triticum turgidum subsp. durum]